MFISGLYNFYESIYFLLCHILFFIILVYFSVSLWSELCMPLSRYIFRWWRQCFLIWYNDCFCEVQTQWNLRLSLCYKILFFPLMNHSLHHFYIFAWLLCCSTMRVSGFLHSFTVELKGLARCGWETVLHKLGVHWQTSDPHHLYPAAPPDIAGHSPNLAWNSKKKKRAIISGDSTDTYTERLLY